MTQEKDMDRMKDGEHTKDRGYSKSKRKSRGILLGMAAMLCLAGLGALQTYGQDAAADTNTTGAAAASAAAAAENSGQKQETQLQTESESETSAPAIPDGWHKGKYYKNGKYVTGLQTIGKNKYYFTESGTPFTGSRKVKGKYMIFGKKGQLLTGNKTRIVKPGNGYSYYVDKNGCAKPGWYYLKSIKKVIYARKTGRLAASETVDGIRFTKKGYCKITNQGRTKILARAFIKKHTKASWSNKKKFKACWRYIIANNRYIATNRKKSYFRGNWVYRVAVTMFTDHLRGDCNGIACATAAVAKELGYKPYVIRSTAQHCFVKANGRYYDNMYGAKFARKSHWKYKVKEKVKF